MSIGLDDDSGGGDNDGTCYNSGDGVSHYNCNDCDIDDHYYYAVLPIPCYILTTAHCITLISLTANFEKYGTTHVVSQSMVTVMMIYFHRW
jgi:hypothetical protein